ncbi:ABC transporter permease [Burkholderia stagnalis]|uniref:Sugar ABC transporter permease n=1 Tax=Burkholderia stagnalis TaxID=1503054 RepID=A0A119KQM4_9BURK|nr:ABC transporter permease [Burkholderia stagnalis]KVZ16237.1 sugar ABC transporter permease [Burkholderia stagnalis]KWA43648.1 sugar ABC transporter permease [Burkholderia stagnalis]KWA63774.1 sugar ABC transporter permease [Burkholderia stagnalis]KWA66432.1 sugar ABC transporter permease [Burkholderia stagnalis]KWC96917.1 sugar ABC transporter permease [Burkholderia stagnalis]
MKPATSSFGRDAASGPRTHAAWHRVRETLERTGIVLVLALLVAVFAAREPAFLNVDNLFSILQSVSIVALLGIGVTITLAAGGFDLSVGSVAASAQMAASYVLVVWHGSTFAAVVACIALGIAAGLFNGVLITRLRVPDQLATLGTLFLLAGLQLIPTGGRSLATGTVLPDGTDATGVFPAAFLALGRMRVFDVVPLPVLMLAVLTVLACIVMETTRWGRVIQAIGGNETAARLAGAPTLRYRIAAYVASGAIASLGGVLIAARVGRGDVSAGHSLLLDAVAAALVGYAVWGAKRPNVFGTVVGAVFVGVLLNGLTMLNAPYYMQDFIKGALLVLALAFTFGVGRRADARG